MTTFAESDFKTAESGGQRWRYIDRGTGPAVILLHGFPDTPHSYAGIASALNAAGYRTLTPYLRGYHADTIVTGRPYDALTIGEDWLLFARALGLTNVTIVGHDWGASAVYGACVTGPDIVKQAVTIAVPHYRTLQPSGPLETLGFLFLVRHMLYLRLPWAEAGTRRSDFAYLDTLYTRWAPNWRGPERDAALERAKEHFKDPVVLTGALDYYRALNRDIDERLLRAMPQRAFIVGGKKDFGGRAGPYYKSAELFEGGGEVLMVDGAGHWPHRENEPVFIERLLAFLKKQL